MQAQARKIHSELTKLGVTPAGSAPPTGVPAAGYYPPGLAPSPFMGAPGYPMGVYPQQAMSAAPSMSSQESAAVKELAELKLKLALSEMKGDMRKEMDTTSRVAAIEAVQRVGTNSAPTVVSNNNNLQQSGSSAAAAAAAVSAPAPVVVRRVVVQPWKSPKPHEGVEIKPAKIPALPGQVIVAYELEGYPPGCCVFNGIKPEGRMLVVLLCFSIPCLLPLVCNYPPLYWEFQRPV